jgi:hypothetical protein
MGMFPERVTLTREETMEKEYLDLYFKTLEDTFPELSAKWCRRCLT